MRSETFKSNDSNPFFWWLGFITLFFFYLGRRIATKLIHGCWMVLMNKVCSVYVFMCVMLQICVWPTAARQIKIRKPKIVSKKSNSIFEANEIERSDGKKKTVWRVERTRVYVFLCKVYEMNGSETKAKLTNNLFDMFYLTSSAHCTPHNDILCVYAYIGL